MLRLYTIFLHRSSDIIIYPVLCSRARGKAGTGEIDEREKWAAGVMDCVDFIFV